MSDIVPETSRVRAKDKEKQKEKKEEHNRMLGVSQLRTSERKNKRKRASRDRNDKKFVKVAFVNVWTVCKSPSREGMRIVQESGVQGKG